MTGYAVVDVETTGLLPDWHHRVAEIAIVHVDRSGTITDEWVTLVNPRRDLGPQHVHGIRAADVRDAPTFADLAGDISARLDGRVVVAHNLEFDALFLSTEYGRAGVPARIDGLCTMHLAQRYLDSPSRSLAACCRVAGIAQHAAHSALDDARAAAGLLARFLSLDPLPGPVASLPALTPCGRTASRNTGRTEHFLTRLVERLPHTPGPAAADDYLALLDRALVGHQMSATDQDGLVQAAARLGLGPQDAHRLHVAYLAAITQALTGPAAGSPVGAGTGPAEEDRADLALVASLLGLEPGVTLPPDAPRVAVPPRFRLTPGDVVVFTGDMRDRRQALEDRARAAGLRVNPTHVTRATRLVIAADPDTLSGKATTARRYAVPVVTEPAFDALLRRLEQAATSGATPA
ncbi:MAG TPA: exonuclease domain-containing protein [Pseudonocardiaceae bacterium]